jgi:isopenicillin N synthase-like dioxygenase
MNAPIADLPTVDIDEPNAGSELARGLFETGFFLLRDHVIPRPLLDGVRASTLEFFARPEAERKRLRGSLRGWAPYRSESAPAGYGEDAAEQDACQKYSMGRETTAEERATNPAYFCDPDAKDYFQKNVFPNEEMGASWQAYYERMDALCLRLLELVRKALGLAPEVWSSVASDPVSVLRFLAYPDQAGGIRMGAHYDDTLLTVLHQSVPQNGFAALQVMLPGEDEWHAVAPSDDVFVVNIGEALTYISGGRVVATRHRVVAPSKEQSEGSARTSLVHFFLPNWNARLWPGVERGVDANLTRFDHPELREPDGSVLYYKALRASLEHQGQTRHVADGEDDRGSA